MFPVEPLPYAGALCMINPIGFGRRNGPQIVHTILDHSLFKTSILNLSPVPEYS